MRGYELEVRTAPKAHTTVFAPAVTLTVSVEDDVVDVARRGLGTTSRPLRSNRSGIRRAPLAEFGAVQTKITGLLDAETATHGALR